MKKILFIIALSVIFFSTIQGFSQSKKKPLTRILFIFDCSNSMNAKWERGRSKVDIAREIMSQLLDSLKNIPDLELALRMYGHQSPVPPQDCDDTKLEVPFGKNNVSLIREKLMNTVPKGTTPIARSLEKCAGDFPPCSNCRNVIILVTDGIEACDGDPCAVALGLQRKGITLKPYVIGIGLDVETVEAFECLGTAYNADNQDKLKEVFDVVITQAIKSTSVQINLLDIYGKPKETNVPMLIKDKGSNDVLHKYIHTLNREGNPDTITLDPLLKYDVMVYTLPPQYISDMEVVIGEHNIIEKPAPQGSLMIKQEDGYRLSETKVIVREKNISRTLNVQEFGEKVDYIVGSYDLEILTLPRIYKYNVDIKQDQTTSIVIKQPGLANIDLPSAGFATLFVYRNERYEWVKNLNYTKSAKLVLQPGSYMLVFRAKYVNQTEYSKVDYFKIRSGRSVSVDL